MLTLIGLAALVLVPSALVVGVLLLAERWQRARATLVARQVAVTDAIHRELGAVVAPVARRRGLGGWELRIAVPFERPDLVGAVTAIARRALAHLDERGADTVPIVLVPRRAAGSR
jgi:hypothetical protein